MKKGLIWKITAVCVSICIILGVAVGIHYVNDREKDYKTAKNYLDEANLIYDGLSRMEIIDVYNDIISESFTNENTENVIRKSVKEVLDYVNLSDKKLTKRAMEQYLSRLAEVKYNNVFLNARYDDGTCSYGIRLIHEYDGNGEYKSTIGKSMCKYDAGELIWEIILDSDGYDSWNAIHISDGFIVYSVFNCKKIMKISHDGEIVQSLLIDDPEIVNHNLCAKYVNVRSNGSCDVFMCKNYRGSNPYSYIVSFDANANKNVHRFSEYDIGEYDVFVPLEDDGYILLKKSSYAEKSCALRLDSDFSTVTEYWTKSEYEEAKECGDLPANAECMDIGMDEMSYEVEDAVNFGNKLYISLTATPKGYTYDSILYRVKKGETEGDIFSQVSAYINEHDKTCTTCVDSKNSITIDENGIMKIARTREEHIIEYIVKLIYSAKLIECDLDTLKAKNVYSVNESFGGSVSVKGNGKLYWDVESDIFVEYQLPSLSWTTKTLMLSTNVKEYKFTDKFEFIDKEKTFRWCNRSI